jgi:hypothetical protein
MTLRKLAIILSTIPLRELSILPAYFNYFPFVFGVFQLYHDVSRFLSIKIMVAFLILRVDVQQFWKIVSYYLHISPFPCSYFLSFRNSGLAWERLLHWLHPACLVNSFCPDFWLISLDLLSSLLILSLVIFILLLKQFIKIPTSIIICVFYFRNISLILPDVLDCI